MRGNEPQNRDSHEFRRLCETSCQYPFCPAHSNRYELPLLALRYYSISDAQLDLGQPEEIRLLFTGFQKYLYQVA